MPDVWVPRNPPQIMTSIKLHPDDMLPEPGSVLADKDAVKEARALGVEVRDGDREARLILVANGENVVGYVNRCPHARAPLDWVGGKFFDPSGKYLRCALHGALFRPEDGHCLSGPCAGDDLRAFPIEVEGQHVVAANRAIS